MRKISKHARVRRSFSGSIVRIAPRQGGALAQCAFCTWGEFYADRKRMRYSAMARAGIALREHCKLRHPEKDPGLSLSEWNSTTAAFENAKIRRHNFNRNP